MPTFEFFSGGLNNHDHLARLGIRHNSFSGADIRAIVHVAPLKGENGNIKTTKELAQLQTLSVSVFRDKQQVRALGTVADKGVTRGPRTIAGSMIFTMFDESVLADLLRIPHTDFDYASPQDAMTFKYTMVDQLPPFDITVNFANELGATSTMFLTGIDLHSEGQVMSIEDLITESTIQYTARNMVFMHATDRGYPRNYPDLLPTETPKQITFDSILRKDHGQYLKILQKGDDSFK